MTRGFVLVNALIIVAALSAAVVVLLARAESGRVQLSTVQGAAQTAAYLDAFETYAILVINRDTLTNRASDHLGETWARTDLNVALDRGQVTGRLRDMQAGFNLNWLANPKDIAARAAFERLIVRLGLPPRVGTAIAVHLRPAGPRDASAYARSTLPVAPVGGALALIAQLSDVPGLDAEIRARLAPVVTVLPGETPLNVNTAPADVLAALLPGLSSTQLTRFLAERRSAPFEARDGFVAVLGSLAPSAVPDDAELERFAIGSNWFEATMSATLDGHTMVRRSALERRPLHQGARVAWAIGY